MEFLNEILVRMMDGNIKVPFGGKTLHESPVDNLLLDPEMMSLILPYDIDVLVEGNSSFKFRKMPRVQI